MKINQKEKKIQINSFAKCDLIDDDSSEEFGVLDDDLSVVLGFKFILRNILIQLPSKLVCV